MLHVIDDESKFDANLGRQVGVEVWSCRLGCGFNGSVQSALGVVGARTGPGDSRNGLPARRLRACLIGPET